MYQIVETEEFVSWITGLKDRHAKVRILTRLEQVKRGNFGDVKSVGDGVHELRVHVGAGYRVYFANHGKQIILLLCAGDKSSQQRDISKAKELHIKWEE